MVALLALILTSCGSSSATRTSESSPAVERINAAVARTEAPGTAHVVMVTDVTQQSHTRLKTPGASTRFTDHLVSTGDIKFVGPNLKLTTTDDSDGFVGEPGTTSTATEIYIGNRLYTGASQPPTVWSRSSSHHAYPFLNIFQMDALPTVAGPITVVGTSEVNERSATKYLVPMPGGTNTERAANQGSRSSSEIIRTSPFVLSVWLDRSGRVVKTQATVRYSISPGSTVSVQTSTTTLSDFGEGVQITAPPHLIGE